MSRDDGEATTAAEAEVERLEREFEDSLRVAGLKRGQENALVGDFRELRRATRRWVADLEEELAKATTQAREATVKVERLCDERDAAVDERSDLAAQVRRLSDALEESNKAAEAAAQRHDHQRRDELAAIAAENKTWKEKYVADCEAEMQRRVDEVRSSLVKERDRAVEAILSRLEGEYKSMRQDVHRGLEQAQASAEEAATRADDEVRRREELSKQLERVAGELRRVKAEAAAAAEAAEAEDHAVRTRLANATYRLKVMQMEEKARLAKEGLKKDKENHALEVAKSAHKKELAALRSEQIRALDMVESRVQRVLAEKQSMIKSLQGRLAREAARASSAEQMLRQLDEGLRSAGDEPTRRRR